MKARIKKILPGLLIVFVVAGFAYFLGKLVPVVGGPVFGILIGIILALFIKTTIYKEGLKFSSKRLLQFSIILIGFEMNFHTIFDLGFKALICLFVTLTVALLTAFIAGKLLRVEKNTNILVGVGTAICGGSAIAATAPVIKANDEEVASAISTIFLFNIIAVFTFPLIGHALGLSDTGFGIWAGTAINDTSSVVAASFSYSDKAGSIATVVKLTRTLMIIPVTIALSLYQTKGQKSVKIKKIFPWFILGFVFTSIIRTTGLLPLSFCEYMVDLGKFLIIMAMVAIGLNTNIKSLLTNGKRPILLGFICWFFVATSSLIVQYFLGLLYL